jgi:hypothetical protein
LGVFTASTLFVFALGCGQAPPPPTVVTGKVTYKEVPLIFGTLVFFTKSDDKMLVLGSAKISSQGSFQMSGIPLGDVFVAVQLPNKNSFLMERSGFGQGAGGMEMLLKDLTPEERKKMKEKMANPEGERPEGGPPGGRGGPRPGMKFDMKKMMNDPGTKGFLRMLDSPEMKEMVDRVNKKYGMKTTDVHFTVVEGEQKFDVVLK